MNDLTSKYVTGKSGKFNPNLVFLENEIKNYRILVLQGGTRSGKTYSTIQWMWRNVTKFSGVKYSVVRATFNALKSTVLEDFIEIGRDASLYTDANHNLTDKIYEQNGNKIDFFSSDDDEKVRGRKRDVLYLNEAPELDWKIVKQLLWRTTSKIIIDYNPSYPESWVYDNILERKDCAVITTTYADNPYLSIGQLDEIEWMRENDPDSYLIYGLGQRGELRGQVYKHWKRIKEMPKEYPKAWVIDFGFSNSECCIAEFSKHNRAIYAQEKIYKLGQTNLHISIHLYFCGVTQNSVVIADSAEPKSIAELRRQHYLEPGYIKNELQTLGYDSSDDTVKKVKQFLSDGVLVLGAKKGQDSVDMGIQKVKQFEVFITEDSVNAWKEYRLYRWGEDPKTGVLLNVPIKKFDHFADCLRMYAMADGVYH